jgi:hypothetical protein
MSLFLIGDIHGRPHRRIFEVAESFAAGLPINSPLVISTSAGRGLSFPNFR